MADTMPVVNELALERPSLSTIAKFLDSEGKFIEKVAEVLMQTNSIIEDVPLVEANSLLEHWSSYEVSMPKAYNYEFNRGIPSSHAEVGQRRESLSQFASRSTVDAQLYKLQSNGPQWRFYQDQRHIRSLNDAVTWSLFYGDLSKNPYGINGLATRYNTLDKKKSENANQIFSMGGVTGKKLSSIYAVSWGETTIHGLYPKGMTGTLDYQDLGQIPVQDGAGNFYMALVAEYYWRFGIAIPDFRSVVRMCNIDIDNLLLLKSNATRDEKIDRANNVLMGINTAMRNLDPVSAGSKVVLYANKDVIACLQNAATLADSTQVRFTEVLNDNKAERNVKEYNINGFTLKRCDAISSDEEEVK